MIFASFLLKCVNSSTATESSESQAQENNENPVIKIEEKKKVNFNKIPVFSNFVNHFLYANFLCIFQDVSSQKATPDAGTETSPVKRRGRPPKAGTASGAAEKSGTAAPASGGAGRGRKRATDASADAVNPKTSKQQQNDEGTKRQIDLQR